MFHSSSSEEEKGNWFDEDDDIGQATGFDFSALHYTTADLEQATHPTELKGTEDVVLRFDAAHHGLGTGSCGPGVQEKYKLKIEEGKSITFEFLMEPVGVGPQDGYGSDAETETAGELFGASGRADG